jgi:hemerythrin superfamily protein
MSTTPRKTITVKPSSKSAGSDAIKLLSADHKEVNALFQQYKKLAAAEAPADQRQTLTVHATIEEEIFYPAARECGVDAALLDEADVEHATAKDLISQLQSMQADDELYDAKVTVLGEYIDHHVKEEQDEMFPACRKAKMDLDAVGADLEARKLALTQEMAGEPA